MAWVQGQGEAAKVWLYKNGKVRFNTAAHVALSDGFVECLSVFYDSDTNRLGFRRGTCANSERVLFNEEMEYSIQADKLYDSLGVEIAENITLDLQPPAPPTPTSLGDEGIYWVQLPE